MNNIERIENLEGCESLEKLDLTLNFIGELTSVASLKYNIHLKTLYLTGNPCTDYDGYREYVIVTLPQLKSLDGKDIERSERIRAAQVYPDIKETILIEEENYKVERQKKKNKSQLKIQEILPENDNIEMDEGKLKEFWSQKCDHSPETRVMLAEHIRKEQRTHSMENDFTPPVRTYRLFSNDGRPLNVNEAKIPFLLKDDSEKSCLILDVFIYKHMDTSLIDVDVEPNYVKVCIKGKVLQLVLPEEVFTSQSIAQRSQTSGHLVITMPKVKCEGRRTSNKVVTRDDKTQLTSRNSYSKRQELEIGPAVIHQKIETISKTKDKGNAVTAYESEDYSEIPPLEDTSD